MAETELERIYTIPLRKVKAGSRNGRADRAVRALREYLIRHMKSDDIWIDDAVNQVLWARGKFAVPSRVRVRAVKFDDGVVEVSLPEEDAMTSIREQLKEEREAKAPILPTPEDEAEPAAAEAPPEPKDAKAPRDVRKSDSQAAATPKDSGGQRHEHAEEAKAPDEDKAAKDRD